MNSATASPREIVLDFARKVTFSIVNAIVDGKEPVILLKRTGKVNKNESGCFSQLHFSNKKSARSLGNSPNVLL